MKKKIFVGLSLFIVMSLLLAVTACSPKTSSEEVVEEVAPAGETIKVGLAAASSGWPWYATFINTLQNRATDAGWELSVFGADGDVTTQINNIQDLIAAGVDYLIVGPVDGQAVISSLKDAFDAGIDVIIIGNFIEESGNEFVKAIRIPDDYQMGFDSAELMVEALGGEGKIFVVEGLPGQPAVIARLEAYDDVFGGTGIEVVDSQPANWDSTKAIEVTENLLTSYPDIDGILSMDGSMTPGIVQVVNEKGLDIPIVGLGGTAAEIALVKDGSVYGTTCMSPAANANAAADAIQALVDGEVIEKIQSVPSPKTTTENADSCPGDW